MTPTTHAIGCITRAERFLEFQKIQQDRTGCKELMTLLMKVGIIVGILSCPVLVQAPLCECCLCWASLTAHLTLSADPARDAVRTVAESAARPHRRWSRRQRQSSRGHRQGNGNKLSWDDACCWDGGLQFGIEGSK